MNKSDRSLLEVVSILASCRGSRLIPGLQPVEWWTLGLWFDGRAWLWLQRLRMIASLPLSRPGFDSDPWQRPAPRHLGKLLLGGSLVLAAAGMVCLLV